MIINHNMSSINANNVLKFKTKDVDAEMTKLSSGLKINKAGDDAANLAVSEKMRAQIRGLLQAEKNVQNGVSLIQTTEGFAQETQDLTQRMRELAVQSANGIYTQEDRMYIQVEVSQLVDEVNRIASQAHFNKISLLKGDSATAGQPLKVTFQVGANMNESESISINSMYASALFVENGQKADVKLDTQDNANKLLGIMDEALKKINEQRANLGAFQNRFETAQKGIAIAAENLQASESIIRDTNMATEAVNFAKDSILTRTGTSMLAQANTRAQGVLQLLG